MENFSTLESPTWHFIDYADVESQRSVLYSVYFSMVNSRQIVAISEKTIRQIDQFYPDLRSMKKQDRKPILRKKQGELKELLRNILKGLKTPHHFRVNGYSLTARLYDTGIREVMEKITQEKACILFQSKQIFQNARYLYSTQDYDRNPNVCRWNYFCTPVRIRTNNLCVRIAIRDIRENEFHLPESQIYHWGIKQFVQNKTDVALGGGKPDS